MACCENNFCIYQEKSRCTLSNTALDFQGLCLDCILVKIEEKQLIKLKEEARERYDW